MLLANSLEMGQPALASAAALSKTSLVAPGTLAVVVSAIRVTAKPPSVLARVTAALVSILVGGQARAAQLRAQRHGEAACVGRGDQLFGGGAGVGAFKTRGEGVVGVLQYAGRRGDGAFAFLQ